MSSSSSSSSNGTSTAADYELSAQLTGHDYAVRDIAINPLTGVIATLEERGRVHTFTNVSNTNQYLRKPSQSAVRIHDSLAFTIQSVDNVNQSARSQEPYASNTFITGGGDKTARAFVANGSKFYEPLEPHGNAVASISVTRSKEQHANSNLVITGSWDGIARIWSDQKPIVQLTGGEHSCEVLGHSSGLIITGSANKHIQIFNLDGKLMHKISNAHDHAIRKIIELSPTHYATAGNDGLVRIWRIGSSTKPDLTIEAHSLSDNPDHPKFIYGLAYDAASHQILTCGEDATARVFDAKSGKQVQLIRHPAPVRSVKVLSDSNIITGCADRVARVFTRNPQLHAAKEEVAEYNELVKLAHVSGMKPLNQSSVADESALKTPGKKEGEVKVVNVADRGPIVYQWSNEANQWIEIGEALGQNSDNVSGQTGKSQLDGKDYDYVTEVYITDTNAVKLGFNRDEDPDDIASAFIAKHGLTPDMKFQIVEHLKPMIDMNAVRLKRQQMQADAMSQQLRHVPSWLRGGGFVMHTEINKLPQMREKLLKTNTTIASEHQLNEQQVAALQHVLKIIETPSMYHKAALTNEDVGTIYRLLQWPTTEIPAVFDLLRIVMLLGTAYTSNLANDFQSLYAALLRHATSGTDTHLTLLLKIAANIVSKRPRSASERQSPPTIPPDLTQFLSSTIQLSSDRIAQNAAAKDGLLEAQVYLLHDIICWLGRSRIEQSPLYELCTASAIKLAQHPTQKQKIIYYSLMTLGSIASITPALKQQQLSQHIEDVESLIGIGYTSSNAATKEVSQDVAIVLGLR